MYSANDLFEDNNGVIVSVKEFMRVLSHNNDWFDVDDNNFQFGDLANDYHENLITC